MNHYAIQQGNALSACDDMRACSRDSVVCPKPRRFGLLSVTHNDPVRSLRWHLGHQAELYDAKAGSDILDILLPKGSFGVEPFSCTEIASPHPFFCGSPPSRVANPLIQDARFGDEKPIPLSPSPLSPTAPPLDLSSSPSSSARKGGFVRSSFGNKPAVRVEGFDCLDRDRRNCSIPTLA